MCPVIVSSQSVKLLCQVKVSSYCVKLLCQVKVSSYCVKLLCQVSVKVSTGQIVKGFGCCVKVKVVSTSEVVVKAVITTEHQ